MYVAPEITLTEHQRYWLKHVRACEASGKRITEYATDYGLGVRAMYDGKRVLVKKGVLPRTRATRFQRGRWLIRLWVVSGAYNCRTVYRWRLPVQSMPRH